MNVGVAVLGTNGVDATNRDGSGATTAAPVTILTGGTNGTIVPEIVVKAVVDPADSTILIFLHDGSNFYLWEEFDIGNPAAGSATVASYREVRNYDNCFVKNGWTIKAVVTAAPTSGKINVIGMGLDI